MRLKTIALFTSSLLLSVMALGQNRTIDKAVILSGGVAEFGTGPFDDFASIGYYNPENQSYTFKDSIYTQSIQNGFIQDDIVTFGAGDSVIRYNLSGESRQSQVAFPQISFVSGNANRLAVGNFSLGNRLSFPFVSFFQPDGLSAIDTIPNDSLTSPADVAFINDKAYVGFNIGEQNSFSDSLGRIAVYNFATNTYERNLKLDTLSAGISKLFVYNDKVHGVCQEYDQLMTLDLATEEVTFQPFNLNNVQGPIEGQLYGTNLSFEVVAFDLEQFSTDNLGISVAPDSGIFLNGFKYDVVNEQAYAAKTNFSDTGYVEVYDSDGQIVTSFPTNISVTEILLDYRFTNGKADPLAASNAIQTYPNPATKRVNIELSDEPEGTARLSLMNLKGQVQYEQNLRGQSTASINLEGLPDAAYVVRLQTEKHVYTRRIVKQ